METLIVDKWGDLPSMVDPGFQFLNSNEQTACHSRPGIPWETLLRLLPGAVADVSGQPAEFWAYAPNPGIAQRWHSACQDLIGAGRAARTARPAELIDCAPPPPAARPALRIVPLARPPEVTLCVPPAPLLATGVPSITVSNAAPPEVTVCPPPRPAEAPLTARPSLRP